MYEYKNPMYEPRIHDFGDSYHLPDVKTDDETESLLVRVKKIINATVKHNNALLKVII